MFLFCTVQKECVTLDGHDIKVDEDCVESQHDQGDYIDSHIREGMSDTIMRMLTKGEIDGGGK